MSAARPTQDGSVNHRDDRIMDGGRCRIIQSVLLVQFLEILLPNTLVEQSFLMYLCVQTIMFELSFV